MGIKVGIFDYLTTLLYDRFYDDPGFDPDQVPEILKKEAVKQFKDLASTQELVSIVEEYLQSEGYYAFLLDKAGWADDSKRSDKVVLINSWLYPFNYRNKTHLFLLPRIANPEVLVDCLILKRVGNFEIPVFHSVSGVEYLAVELLLLDWDELSYVQPGVEPIPDSPLVRKPGDARRALEDYTFLKKVLARLV